MEKAIIASENVSGNIGDCKVNEATYNVDLFTVEVVATDSCTGTVIASNQMFDSGWLIFGLLVFVVIGFFGMMFRDY